MYVFFLFRLDDHLISSLFFLMLGELERHLRGMSNNDPVVMRMIITSREPKIMCFNRNYTIIKVITAIEDSRTSLARSDRGRKVARHQNHFDCLGSKFHDWIVCVNKQKQTKNQRRWHVIDVAPRLFLIPILLSGVIWCNCWGYTNRSRRRIHACYP